jgi:hypothetical protein
MLLASTALAAFAMGFAESANAQKASEDPLVKSAIDAYVYFYPLVVFGVSYEVLTNVTNPTW